MQVWNVLLAARCKYGTQKSRQKSPSGHHRTILSGYIFVTTARLDNREKLVKQQYLLYMSSQYVELRPTSGWDRFVNLGHGFRVFAELLHGTLHCESIKQDTTILSITSPNVDRFSIFFTDRLNSKYATKSSLTIPLHLKGVAELPCETSVSENSENLMHASLSTTNHKVV